MYRLIVAGSRDFYGYDVVREVLDGLDPPPSVIISGTARGVDRLGERWAIENGVAVHPFKADWSAHGRRAGHVRNERMAEEADALIAFWDGSSPGTAGMISIARQRGLAVRVVMV